MEFANPHEVSREGAPAKMSIKFKPNVFFSKKTMKAIEPNFKLEVELPKQLPSEEDATIINIISKAVGFLLLANLGVCLVVHFILPLTVCGGDENEAEIANTYSRKEIRKNGFMSSFWPLFNINQIFSLFVTFNVAIPSNGHVILATIKNVLEMNFMFFGWDK